MDGEQKQKFRELTENEKKLIEAVNKGTLQDVQALLREKDVKVDCLDESGMTPLQHAAFRGRKDVAEYLLVHGADVNSNYHENGYTALMFAALSGNTDTTRLMLEHGAKKDKVNSVGRNSAQMAAFVGQHQCVAVINNYYDSKDLEYYTVCRGQEKEPKLPPACLPALLKLLNMSNMHPVKISFHLQEHPELMTESYKVCKVLDLICEKSMKARETDDVMAVKTHYIATVIRKAKDASDLDAWIKNLLRGRDSDGYPEYQDQLIRQALKEFPYVESQLLHTMVRQLAATKIGDHPTSLNILNQGVNGQKFSFDEAKECTTCGEPNAKTCTACKMTHYCNKNCQRLHFFTHKKFCKKLAEEYKKQEEKRKLEEEKQKKSAQQQPSAEQQQQQQPQQSAEQQQQLQQMQSKEELLYQRVNGSQAAPSSSTEKHDSSGAESKGARPKVQIEETTGQVKVSQGFIKGMPGASELLGQQQSVADINNYLYSKDLEYYTICQGQEKEPKLPPACKTALLKLLNMSNMHPVKISLQLQEHSDLMTDSYKVCKVLDLICEKSMKAQDINDVKAVKTHYIATVIRKAKGAADLNAWIESLLRGRDSDGYPEYQDQLIRQALKEFPFAESQLVQTMDRQLAATKIGDHPTSLNILNQAVNGQKSSFDEVKECTTCGEPNAKACAACKMTHYCDKKCQKLHFFTHKKFCKKLTGAESKGARPKVQIEETTGQVKVPPGLFEGMPGASELLRNGAAEDSSLPDINKLLEDPDIIKAFEDDEIIKAFEAVTEDPSKIAEYEQNTKIQDFISKLPSKLNIEPIKDEQKTAVASESANPT